MNKTQVLGILIGIIGIMTYFLTENDIMHTISGALCAVAIGFIFKLISFNRKK